MNFQELINSFDKIIIQLTSISEGTEGVLVFAVPERLFRSIFGNMVSKVSFLVDEAYLHVTNEFIAIRCIDPSHVAMALCFFSSQSCEMNELEIEGGYWNLTGDPFKIGINIHDLIKLLKVLETNQDELITVEVTPKLIKFGGFTLKARIIQSYDEKEDNLLASFKETLLAKYTVHFNIGTDVLSKHVKRAEVVSDLAQFYTKDGYVYIKAEDESGDYDTDICEAKGDGKGIFSLPFLKNIVTLPALASKTKKSKEHPLEISLGDDVPVMILDKIDDFSYNEWLLAPRVEDTGEETEEEQEEETEVEQEKTEGENSEEEQESEEEEEQESEEEEEQESEEELEK